MQVSETETVIIFLNFNFVLCVKGALTELSTGGSPPASISKTFHSDTSDNLLAITEPAVPAPTTIKSNSSRSINITIYFLKLYILKH